MRRGLIWLLVSCLTVTALVLSSCASGPAAPPVPKEYVIGGNLPITGISASLAELMKTGMDMAAADINAKGGIDGVKIRIVYEDFKNSDVQLAVSNLQKLINIDKVPAVVTCTTPVTQASAPIATENKIVHMNLGGISPALLGLSPYVFHVIPNGVIEAEIMANYVYKDKGVRKVGLFEMKDAFGIGVTDAFKKQFPKALQAVTKFVGAIPKSPRAQRDVANWTRKILVKTGGGKFGLLLDKQKIKVVKDKIPRPDLVLVVEDPAHLMGWTNGDSLVNLIRTGAAGISNLQDMETIFKFDRLHRSIRRDAEERGKK